MGKLNEENQRLHQVKNKIKTPLTWLMASLEMSPDKGFPMGTSKTSKYRAPSREVPAERLDSWKEIAAYLKRDERTVRRWEKEGLPVRRKVHKKQASVFISYVGEIDACVEQ